MKMVVQNSDLIFTLVYFLVYISLCRGYFRSRLGHLLPAFNNLISSRSVLYTTNADSAKECAISCLSKEGCYSFFYKEKGFCRMHSTVLDFYTSNATECHGCRYYQFIQDVTGGCPYWALERGYSYNATVGVCYVYRQKNITWDGAYNECADDGGHLLYVDNEAKNDWILNFIQQKNIFGLIVYIDGTDRITEGVYKNYRNQDIVQKWWRPNDPDVNNTEHCIAVWNVDPAGWIDYYCGFLQGFFTGSFVCEIEVS